jgi:hypothetical protein
MALADQAQNAIGRARANHLAYGFVVERRHVGDPSSFERSARSPS